MYKYPSQVHPFCSFHSSDLLIPSAIDFVVVVGGGGEGFKADCLTRDLGL